MSSLSSNPFRSSYSPPGKIKIIFIFLWNFLKASILVIINVAIYALLLSWFIKLLWNNSISVIFSGVKEIDLMQAFILNMLCGLLFRAKG
jgi:hypothetical protein